LFWEDDYEEVMCKLVESLRDMRSLSDSWQMPKTSAISQARARLGWEPLRELFERCAVPVAEPGARQGLFKVVGAAWCRGDTPVRR